MKFFDWIREKIGGGKTMGDSPEGYCPNCWGRQEYQGNFYIALKAEGIDSDNIKRKKGWIVSYAEQYLSGIRLQRNDAGLVCPRCSMRYLPEN